VAILPGSAFILLNFVMKTEDPVTISKLAGYGAMIVPPKYIQEHGSEYFGSHPVGTGPFRFVEYRKDDHLTLAANRDYWNGAPLISIVTNRFVPEPATRVAELRAGRADIAQGVPVSQSQVVKNDPALMLFGSPTVVEFRFDPFKPPAGDIRFRKGYGHRVSTFQSPLLLSNDPSLSRYGYDVQKAKQLLAEAGIKPGTEVTLSFPSNNADFREVAQSMVSYLQAVGLKLVLQPFEQVTYFSDILPHAKTGQIYEFGWGGWTLDFDNTAYLLYHKGEYWNPVFSKGSAANVRRAGPPAFVAASLLRQVTFHLGIASTTWPSISRCGKLLSICCNGGKSDPRWGEIVAGGAMERIAAGRRRATGDRF
jgi:peptide/nickel transport system substrate-binding protein